jgi:hypothetical protein
VLANLEELQHTQIKLHLAGGNETAPAKTERARRQRGCAAAVSIEASQRIDWSAAPDYQERRGFNVAEQPGDQPRGLLALFLITERQVKRPAEYEPMPLIVRGQSPFGNAKWRNWQAAKKRLSLRRLA